MNIERIPTKNKSKTIFKYTKLGGKVPEEDLQRIQKLGIPPIWTDVKISDSPLSYLQVTGEDGKKTQYIYHPLWVALGDIEKYQRLKFFCKKLPLLEKRIKKDLKTPGTESYTLAILFTIMKKTHTRIGNECYAKDNKTYGLTTLEFRHLRLCKKNLIKLEFVGKKGVKQKIEFTDALCYTYLKKLRDARRVLGSSVDRIFSIDANRMNNYLRDAMGSEFSCKDFRTYGSNILFLQTLCALDEPKTKTESKKNINATYDVVAEKLGHTRAISKKSYVMPILAETYEEDPHRFCSTKRSDIKKLMLEFTEMF